MQVLSNVRNRWSNFDVKRSKVKATANENVKVVFRAYLVRAYNHRAACRRGHLAVHLLVFTLLKETLS